MKTNHRNFLLASLLVSIALALTITGGSDPRIGEAVRAAWPIEEYPVFLPFVTKPSNTIFGTVTDNGVAATGVNLELWHYNGATYAMLMTTTSGANGYYQFQPVPPLGAGESYWVYYENMVNPNRLAAWYTRDLTSFPDGSMVNMGSFDIANVVLVSPPGGTKIVPPSSFQWTPRPATLTDSYQVNIFDSFDRIPYYDFPPQGYTGSYNLSSMPPGFQYCNPYYWGVKVNSPDGGIGFSYWAYLLTIHQSVLAGIHGCVTENGVPVSGVTVELFKWTGSARVSQGTDVTSNGYFEFTGQTGLTGTQKYWVEYENPSSDPRLWLYWTKDLTSTTYPVEGAAFIGDFDIKDIPLNLPADGATVSPPTQFEWDVRPNTQMDNYAFELYDFVDTVPFFLSERLGYEDHYTLAGRPPGFLINTPYLWDVVVYDRFGGGGISLDLHEITFSSLGMSATPGEAGIQAHVDQLRARERQRERTRLQLPAGLMQRNAGWRGARQDK